MLLAGAPLVAHHAFSAEFNPNAPVKLQGPITKVELINPHAWIHMKVTKPDGKVEDEFQSAYGYSMSQFGTGSAWSQDISKLFLALNVVTNNGPASIGGGGTPRVPLAPPIGN